MINGTRLRQAREATGLTQTSLAHSLNVDQSAIAHFESGRAGPTDAVLAAIAFRLGFPPAFFRQPDPPALPLGSLLYRARSRLSARDRMRVHRHAELSFEVALLLEPQGSPNPRVPQVPSSDFVRGAAIARSSLGIAPTGPIPSVIAALERGGIWVLPVPLDIEGHDAFSGWTFGQIPVIAITGTHIPPDRLNFSLSHELGHLVLHRSPHEQGRALETAANSFAGEFLMPLDDARTDLTLPLTFSKLSALKVKWHLSMQLLLRRAVQIGVLGNEPYVSLVKEIGRRGWRRNEPYSDRIPVTWPTRWRTAAEQRYSQHLPYRRLSSETNVPTRITRWLLAGDMRERPEDADDDIVQFPSGDVVR